MPRPQATAAGAKEQEAVNALEKHFKAATGDAPAADGEVELPAARRRLDAAEAVRLAISTMQSVLSSDFKASEIEIAVLHKNERFRVLSDSEVDAHLTAISERD